MPRNVTLPSRHTIYVWIGAGLFLSTIGCQELATYTRDNQSIGSTPPLSAAIVLAPDPQDQKFLEALGIRADHQLSQCRNAETCNQAHFLKGLTILHSNPDLASYHFQKVVEDSSPHRLREASRIWLWLLDALQRSKSKTILPQNITRELVQALLNRDLQLLEEPSSLESSGPSDLKILLLTQEEKIKALSEQIHQLSQEMATLKSESGSMQSLKKELRDRDKKVAELTSQLDALRRIDQELKEKAPPTTPSETILPPKEEPRDKP